MLGLMFRSAHERIVNSINEAQQARDINWARRLGTAQSRLDAANAANKALDESNRELRAKVAAQPERAPRPLCQAGAAVSSRIFFAQQGDFAAVRAAETALKAAGFSVGIAQAGAPQALFFGDCLISKWRNLSPMERRMADGEMHGGRQGPVTILPSAGADGETFEAFERVRQMALAAAQEAAA